MRSTGTARKGVRSARRTSLSGTACATGSRSSSRRSSGQEVSLIVYTTPIRNEAGEITAVMKMATDITEIKLLQNQLRESRERYRHLFEEVPCYITIQDRDLRIVEANRQFREDFGDVAGSKCYEVYMHRPEECVPCAVKETFQDGRSIRAKRW